MTFGLTSWLKKQFPDLIYEVPLWYPSREQADQREWLITNGLGGYSSGTVGGAHRRRYHGLLVSALDPPHGRHMILSRVDELLEVDGVEYELATNHWASGVVSPTGYKYLESFTNLPVPTWVFELRGHYLIKQVTLGWGTDTVQIGYYWLPDPERDSPDARLTVRFLAGFRSFHDTVHGSSDDRYPQFVSPKHSVIILNESAHRLCLTWSNGTYEARRQWWWDFQWPEETARAQPDKEDLFLVGCVTTTLQRDEQFSIAGSLDKPVEKPDCHAAVNDALQRQRTLLKTANLPKSPRAEILALACDQFLVSDKTAEDGKLYVIEAYPWFNESGRAAMIGMNGLTLSTRRFDDARRILKTYSARMVNGMLPNRLLEEPGKGRDTTLEYGAADVTLWWAWALDAYQKRTRDAAFVQEQIPLLLDAAKHYIAGTTGGVKADTDGLLRCVRAQHEFTWMDAEVANIPITPRSGKAVEICALWYNFLETVLDLAAIAAVEDPLLEQIKSISASCKSSMQKFWNSDTLCLNDVIEPNGNVNAPPNAAIRPNQLVAIALPHRAFQPQQEKQILTVAEAQLLTPQGLRTLAPNDPGYQGIFGCGFSHADQYHRDLSYHNGTAWPWLLGMYCDAILNVYGSTPETTSRIGLILQPLLTHLNDEACLGSISEIFDGNRPHLPRGCLAHALAVSETMRWLNWQIRR